MRNLAPALVLAVTVGAGTPLPAQDQPRLPALPGAAQTGAGDRSASAANAETIVVKPVGPALTHGYCDDELEKGWNFYCDRERRKKEVEAARAAVPAPLSPPPPAPQPTVAPPEAYPYTAAIETYRKKLDETRARAILEPTPENVETYMRAQKEMTDLASAFTDTWQRVLWQTPDLDINSEYPITSTGGAVYQDQKRVAQDAAVVEAAASLGFMVVVEDQTVCGLCGPQLDILLQLRERTGIAVMAVSKDGSYHPQFPEAEVDTGQLASLGLSDFEAPFIALVEPTSGAVQLLGAGLVTEDQILERVFVLTKVPEGERY